MKVGIIGCGASGMMAAITAARKGYNVIVFEHGEKPGKKLLSTGNGKCNFTNGILSAENYNSEGKMLFSDVYKCFTREDTITFFNSIGIVEYQKNGYYYPRSEQASSFVNCLLDEIKRLNITIYYNVDPKIDKKKEKYIVEIDKKCFDFDRIIIAAGSNAAPKTGSDGSGYSLAIKLSHTVKKPLPALCGLKCKGADFKQISGVRCKARVSLYSNDTFVKEDLGELQLTDYGISGIPVFQISGQALRLVDLSNAVYVNVDYAPEYSMDDLILALKNRAILLNEKSADKLLEGMFNSKLCEFFIKELGIYTNIKCAEISTESIVSLANIIKASKYIVSGHRGFDNAQVCSGGVICDELKPTLESKINKGLYFAGEIIDVNGDCGGYNLQWAWSSGYVAGCLK